MGIIYLKMSRMSTAKRTAAFPVLQVCRCVGRCRFDMISNNWLGKTERWLFLISNCLDKERGLSPTLTIGNNSKSGMWVNQSSNNDVTIPQNQQNVNRETHYSISDVAGLSMMYIPQFNEVFYCFDNRNGSNAISWAIPLLLQVVVNVLHVVVFLKCI